MFGGSGFIGSHTADVLSERGYNVTIFDQVPSPWLRNDQEMIVGDVLNSDLVYEVLEGARYLYLFAGIADIDEARLRPFDTIRLNVLGPTTVLQAAVDSGIKRIVYASTMYVYSSHGSFYRASKQVAEIVIEVFVDNLVSITHFCGTAPYMDLVPRNGMV